MNNQLMFSSSNQKWETDPELLKGIKTHFDIRLDVAASGPNVCNQFLTAEDNGLLSLWSPIGWNWCNPPYSGEFKAEYWLNDALKRFRFDGIKTLFLIPSRTGTKSFQQYTTQANDVVFINGRLKFGSRDYWIEHLNLEICEPKKTDKQLTAIIKKIGGSLCQNDQQNKLAQIWDQLNTKWDFQDWLAMDHLKKDPAPFDSLFVTFGEMTTVERSFLYSFGFGFQPYKSVGWNIYR
ncbi:MAG: DNA N-6-adenine-methyltransferase [Chloroflexota bacterium]